MTDEGNSRKEIWHWKNDEIGVAIQSWFWVGVEFMAWQFSQLERLNGIYWSWVDIPLRPTFYSYFKESFSGKYHIYANIYIYITLENGIVVAKVNWKYLDWLFQKFLWYEHHVDNYKLALDQQIISFGLRINKAPTIQPISEDLHKQWNTILQCSEKRLIRLL